ncbi:hypothetical protein CW703_00635 [Candidatus Bathyarchaeota archaeon]|nr:MAG: hypothetical protein CW703_00635 [Candidatus Bathyarchaeota archaeon]
MQEKDGMTVPASVSIGGLTPYMATSLQAFNDAKLWLHPTAIFGYWFWGNLNDNHDVFGLA